MCGRWYGRARDWTYRPHAVSSGHHQIPEHDLKSFSYVGRVLPFARGGWWGILKYFIKPPQPLLIKEGIVLLFAVWVTTTLILYS